MLDQSKGKQQREYQQSDPSSQKKGYGNAGSKLMPNHDGKGWYPNKMSGDIKKGTYPSGMNPGFEGTYPGTNPYYGGGGYNQPMPQGGFPTSPYGQMMPGGYTPNMPMPGVGMPNQPTPGMTPTPGTGMQQPLPYPTPSSGFPGGVLPRERSYIENILRLNRGKQVTAYFTFQNNDQWNAKTFTGLLQEAGKDHIVIADPQTGKWYLLLMIYLDYVEFEEQIEYQYPFR
ncbi:spore coat protein GerQ [Bacillaceae bacterium W0354]